LLHPAAPVVESWYAGAVPQGTQHRGCLSFRTDGRWMIGCARVDDRQHPGGLQGASEQVYRELFALLQASASPQLLRLWNYIADINLETGGIERYRQFNVGRQQAFLAARRTAFDGAPAACALGTWQGPLTVHFLAGPQATVAVENPRQVSAYRYPSDYGPSSPTFSRAALAVLGGDREAMFISGTASIVGHATQHPGDVRAQTEETLRNIDALLARAAELGAAKPRAIHRRDALDCTVYVRHRADLGVIRETFERIVGPDSASARRAIYLHADICRADLLVEIEAQSIVDHGTGTRRIVPIHQGSS
jgi:enamine deaminase RidA (YjgF/YER057c/UK114 family)